MSTIRRCLGCGFYYFASKPDEEMIFFSLRIDQVIAGKIAIIKIRSKTSGCDRLTETESPDSTSQNRLPMP
jgi:hypothetical protein